MDTGSPKIALGAILRRLVAADPATTSAEIAEAVGVSPSAFSKYTNGIDVPRLPTLIRIADHFSVTLDYLVRGEASRPTASTDELLQHIDRGRQEAQAEQFRQELIARFANRMIDYAEEVSEAITEQRIWPGVLNLDEMARIEGRATKVDLLVPYLDEDIRTEGEPLEIFFKTADNLRREVKYRVLVDRREDKDWSELMAEYRRTLHEKGGCPPDLVATCFEVRQLDETVFAGFANYWLRPEDYPFSEFAEREENEEGDCLFSILQPGLHDSNAHLVLRAEHAKAAVVFFDRWWNDPDAKVI